MVINFGKWKFYTFILYGGIGRCKGNVINTLFMESYPNIFYIDVYLFIRV